MQKNVKLIFVRHGETNLNTGKLTLRGVRQIKNALKYLSNENIDAICQVLEYTPNDLFIFEDDM